MKFKDGYRLVNRAKRIARLYHNGQTYGDGIDFYDAHLSMVANQIMGMDDPEPELITAAWLHDILEDTRYKEEDLRASFGDNIANAVVALTIPKNELNRKQRFELKLPELRANPIATAVRLADRLCNMEACLYTTDTKKPQMYLKEYDWFLEYMAYSKDNKALEGIWAGIEQAHKLLQTRITK